ncbi:MAG: hypothetical protein AMXMBFR64_38950 [Myxococcales bacterium]
MFRPDLSSRAALLGALALTALLGSCRGCDRPDPAQPQPPVKGTDAGTSKAPPTTKERVGSAPDELPVRRWVANLPVEGGPPACPQPTKGSWKVSELMPAVPADLGLTPPEGGRRFCAYEWAGKGVDAKEVAAMLPPEAQAAPDPPVITGLGLDAAKEQLRLVSLHQNRGVTLEGAQASPVVVAVVDSAPRNAAQPVGSLTVGRSHHGTTVGLAIHQMVCPKLPVGDQGCPVRLSPQLALDSVIEGGEVREEAGGGNVGTLSSVARAVVQGVLDWAAFRKTSPEARLVVNLSIGWDPAMVSDEATSAGMAAVLTALRFAERNGALIVAAAGNRSGGAAESAGPMFPARWEATQKSTGCAPGAQGACPPLLYAVAGVDDDGHPLTNVRAEGIPRLAANGLQVTVSPTQLGGGTSPALTGSSMAAAAVSGAAAAVLAARSGITREEVIGVLYESGKPTGLTADFCPGTLSGCKTSVRMVGPGGADLPPSVPKAPPRSAVAEELATVTPDEVATVTVQVAVIDAPACGEGYRLAAADGEEATCAEVAAFRAPRAVLVHPQPGSPGCDVCTLFPEGQTTRRLWYQANKELTVSKLVVSSLVLHDSVKRTSTVVRLGDKSVEPGRLLVIEGLQVGAIPFDRAEVVATFEQAGTKGVIVDQLAY